MIAFVSCFGDVMLNDFVVVLMFHGMCRLGISSAGGLMQDEVVCKVGVRMVHGLYTLGASNGSWIWQGYMVSSNAS